MFQILCGQFVDNEQFADLPVAIEIEIVGAMETDCQIFITEVGKCFFSLGIYIFFYLFICLNIFFFGY